MIHLTLNTGHARESPRHEVRDDVIATLRPLVHAGGGQIPGFDGRYTVQLTRQGADAVFTVYRDGKRPVLTCGLAQDDAEAVWDALLTLWWPHGWHTTPTMPEDLPWLGVALLPAALHIPPEDLYALADFERGLAWTLIEEDTP